jgi:hypothetical protein
MCETVDVLIVGAGFSGLCMAIKLREAGMNSFLVIEKAEEIGGTWWSRTRRFGAPKGILAAKWFSPRQYPRAGPDRIRCCQRHLPAVCYDGFGGFVASAALPFLFFIPHRLLSATLPQRQCPVPLGSAGRGCTQGSRQRSLGSHSPPGCCGGEVGRPAAQVRPVLLEPVHPCRRNVLPKR